MKFLASIGWFLFDIAVWIANFFGYILKKIVKVIKYFFNRENFQKNKIIYLVVIILVIFSAGFFIFKKYTIVFISKDIKNQSAAEKTYMTALKKAEVKKLDQENQESVARPENISNKAVTPSRRVSIRGTVKSVEDGKIIITTNKQEEKSIIINDKTRIMPGDKKLETNQTVTVSAYQENDNIIADRILINMTKSKKE